MDPKYSLQWKDFQPHVTKNFINLWNEQRYCDVTLVTDDHQKQITAHKIVLSACSEYFDNILSTNNHSHPLLCLDGITYENLKMVVDYVYYGEVQVKEERLAEFFKVAKKFRLHGLLNLIEDTKEAVFEDKEALKHNLTQDMNAMLVPKTDDFQFQSDLNKKSRKNGKTFEKDIIFHSNDFESLDALDKGIDEIISTAAEEYFCKECNYTTKHIGHLRDHAETHLKGLIFKCKFCGKQTKSRKYFRSHYKDTNCRDNRL